MMARDDSQYMALETRVKKKMHQVIKFIVNKTDGEFAPKPSEAFALLTTHTMERQGVGELGSRIILQKKKQDGTLTNNHPKK